MTEHVAIENIQRVFTQGARDLHVLRGASLALAAGEVVALVGPSGSGKSSLLHIVGLLEKPDGGAISLRGQLIDMDNDGARTAMRLQHIGFVYQVSQSAARIYGARKYRYTGALGRAGA